MELIQQRIVKSGAISDKTIRLLLSILLVCLQQACAFDPSVVKKKGSPSQIILIVAMCIVGVIIIAIIIRLVFCRPQVRRQIKESKYDLDHFNRWQNQKNEGHNHFKVKDALGVEMQHDFTEPPKKNPEQHKPNSKHNNYNKQDRNRNRNRNRDLESGDLVIGQPVRGSQPTKIQKQKSGGAKNKGSAAINKKKVPSKYQQESSDDEDRGIDMDYQTVRKDQNKGPEDRYHLYGNQDELKQNYYDMGQRKTDNYKNSRGESNNQYPKKPRNIYNSDSSESEEEKGEYRQQIKKQLKRDASQMPAHAKYQG